MILSKNTVLSFRLNASKISNSLFVVQIEITTRHCVLFGVIVPRFFVSCTGNIKHQSWTTFFRDFGWAIRAFVVSARKKMIFDFLVADLHIRISFCQHQQEITGNPRAPYLYAKKYSRREFRCIEKKGPAICIEKFPTNRLALSVRLMCNLGE